jgi:hypothetical protein
LRLLDPGRINWQREQNGRSDWTLADLAERSGLPPAERDKLTAFQADLAQTIREDRRRAAGTARVPLAAS